MLRPTRRRARRGLSGLAEPPVPSVPGAARRSSRPRFPGRRRAGSGSANPERRGARATSGTGDRGRPRRSLRSEADRPGDPAEITGAGARDGSAAPAGSSVRRRLFVFVAGARRRGPSSGPVVGARRTAARSRRPPAGNSPEPGRGGPALAAAPAAVFAPIRRDGTSTGLDRARQRSTGLDGPLRRANRDTFPTAGKGPPADTMASALRSAGRPSPTRTPVTDGRRRRLGAPSP